MVSIFSLTGEIKDLTFLLIIIGDDCLDIIQHTAIIITIGIMFLLMLCRIVITTLLMPVLFSHDEACDIVMMVVGYHSMGQQNYVGT